MITRRSDLIRISLLVPLLLLAAVGKSSLSVDVENLAMKSVGTATERVAQVRTREFGNQPYVVLLASPIAPELLAPSDLTEIEHWIETLRARDEVTSIEQAPTPHAGERCILATVRTTDAGRYAEAVVSLSAAARASCPPTYRLAISGYPAVEVAIAQELVAEQARILPLIVAILALVLLAVYRSPVLVAGALVAPLTGVLLLEGLQGFLGLAIDPMSALLGPSILTVGVASSVHVLERYRHVLRGDVPVELASRVAARELRVPFFLTMLTTVVGFFGLLMSPIPAVRRFGLLAATGVVLAIAVTLLCLPSLLRLLHRPGPESVVPAPRAVLSQALLLRRWSSTVIAGSLVLAAIAFSFMGDLRVDGDPLHVLSADHVVRRDTESIARQMGGSEVFELLLPPTASPGLTGPLATLALTAQVTALEGVVGLAGRPRTSERGYQLLPFLLASGGDAHRERTFTEAEQLAHAAGWSEAASTGLSVRIARDSSDLVSGQRKGILATLFGLWLVMSIGFRSPGLGLLGLIPNVLPLILIQGSMAYLDHPLSVASSMIGTVMLGLVVDDTIHFIHAFRKARGSATRRIARTLGNVKRPIVITTLVLCAGFSATLAGELQATVEFGGLAVATLVVALLADVVLLPAILLWGQERRLRRT